jgi:hypothetical protein
MSIQATLAPALEAAGIVVNGPNPWDPQVKDERLWHRVLAEGSLGLGEAYMDGWWEVDDMAEFFGRLLSRHVDEKLRLTVGFFWQVVQARVLNMQNIARSRRVIKDDGLFMLHTIGSQHTTQSIEPWLEKYIFPGGVIPSIAQIGKAIDGLWTIVDLHNIGPHYDKTLCAWDENFERNWKKNRTPEEERFFRMWKYYLLCCAGGFRAKILQVWQFVLSTTGVPDGYITQR